MSSRPVVLVTGAAQRLGRAIALDLARNGCDVAVHYRAFAARRRRDRRRAARRSAPRAAAFAADLADEAACRALVPAVLGALRRGSTRSSTTPRPSSTTTPASFGYAAMERHWRANTAPAVLLAQALHAHAGRSAGADAGCVVNLLDQKLCEPEPRLLLVHAVEGRAAGRDDAAGAGARAAAARLRRRARRHAAVGADERQRIRRRPPADAARPLVDAGRRRARRALPDRIAGDHRHHPAGRRRPAPAAAAARRAVPRRRHGS